MLLAQSFDINDLPVQDNDYSPIPEGEYQVTIKSAEVRSTKDKTGEYISIRYDVTGPTHSNRVLWGNINIKNKSTQAENIGRQQLGSLLRAIGKTRIEDTDELIGNSLQVKVSIRHQEGYEPTNEIKSYKAIAGGTLPKPSAAPSEAPAQGDSKSAPPWAKK